VTLQPERISMNPACDPITHLSVDERQALLRALDELRSDADLRRPRLLLFGLGSFGDALQVTPLLHCLRRHFAGAKLILVHPNPLVPSLLARHPDVDRIDVLPQRAHAAMRATVLCEALADLVAECRYVVQYTLVPGSKHLNPQQREFVESAQARQLQWLPFVRRFPFDNDELWRAAAARGWSMPQLMAQTSGFPDADFETYRVTLSAEDSGARSELPERYVAVCNSAEALAITEQTWTKVLPRDKMMRIVKGLKAFALPVVLLGARDDALIDGVDIDLRGRTSIREVAAVLRDAAAFVGPEGGLSNLARAVGTRSVVFFGSTPPEFFGLSANINVRPRRCGGCWWTTPSYLHQCPRLQAAPECTGSIPEAAVVAGVREILL
jgi:ADP-heptose:LPS heptosyltransferase